MSTLWLSEIAESLPFFYKVLSRCECSAVKFGTTTFYSTALLSVSRYILSFTGKHKKNKRILNRHFVSTMTDKKTTTATVNNNKVFQGISLLRF